jgi:tetratricopeptide (TPR) repeat protein
MWAAIIFILLGAMGIYVFGIKKKENFSTRRLRLMTNLIGAKGTRIFLLGMAVIMLFAGTASLTKQFYPTKEAAIEPDKYSPSKEVADAQKESDMISKAADLMTKHQFQESMDAYQQLADEFPKDRGYYLGEVGVNHFLLNEYEKAIDYYVKARDNGADKSKMDDNIWESCEALYEKSGKKANVKKYLTLCPDGAHTKEAKKISGK